jgi:hypothetical protein
VIKPRETESESLKPDAPQQQARDMTDPMTDSLNASFQFGMLLFEGGLIGGLSITVVYPLSMGRQLTAGTNTFWYTKTR